MHGINNANCVFQHHKLVLIPLLSWTGFLLFPEKLEKLMKPKHIAKQITHLLSWSSHEDLLSWSLLHMRKETFYSW